MTLLTHSMIWDLKYRKYQPRRMEKKTKIRFDNIRFPLHAYGSLKNSRQGYDYIYRNFEKNDKLSVKIIFNFVCFVSFLANELHSKYKSGELESESFTITVQKSTKEQ